MSVKEGFNEEKFIQLNEKINFREDQSNLFISNQHFYILKDLFDKGEITSNIHIPFAFAYIYFVTYMFRYAKYDDYVPLQYEIKELLGYSKKDKKLNYLIKEDGVLDNNNLTKTIYDFPLVQDYDTYSTDILEFTMMKDLYEDYEWKVYKKIRSDSFCKYPVLGFYDEPNSYDGITLFNEGGSFFESYNFTIIPFEVFNYSLANDKIGVIGFYLYSFIKYKNGILGESYGASSDTLAKETSLGKRTVERYLSTLRKYNMISSHQEMKYFIIGIGKDDSRKPNSYIANDFDKFTYEEINIKKPKYITKEKYDKLNNNPIDINATIIDEINDEIDRLLG